MDGKRKLATDDIVAKALEEEGEKKRLKKSVGPAQQSTWTMCDNEPVPAANMLGSARQGQSRLCR